MGFQTQIYSILRVSWSILAKCVFICQQAPAKPTDAFSGEECTPLANFDCFLIDLSRWYIFASSVHEISVANSQRFLLAKRPQRRRTRRNGCSRRLLYLFLKLSGPANLV